MVKFYTKLKDIFDFTIHNQVVEGVADNWTTFCRKAQCTLSRLKISWIERKSNQKVFNGSR